MNILQDSLAWLLSTRLTIILSPLNEHVFISFFQFPFLLYLNINFHGCTFYHVLALKCILQLCAWHIDNRLYCIKLAISN